MARRLQRGAREERRFRQVRVSARRAALARRWHGQNAGMGAAMTMGRQSHDRPRRARAAAGERAPGWVWWTVALMLAAATVPAVRAQAPTTAPSQAPGGTSAVPEVAPTAPPGAGGDTPRPQGDASRPVPDPGMRSGVVTPPVAGNMPVIAPPATGTTPVVPPSGQAK